MQKIKTRESKRKLRRWSFTAVITVPVRDAQGVRIKDDKGNEVPAPEPIVRRQRGRKVKDLINGQQIELRTMTIGSSGVARDTALELENEMRSNIHKDNPDAKIVVVPIPHETVSDSMLQQVQGYKEYSDILQLAFELATEDAVHRLHPIGSYLTWSDEEKAQHLKAAKDKYYKQAMEIIRPPKSKEERLAALESEPVMVDQAESVAGSDDVPVGGTTGESDAFQPA